MDDELESHNRSIGRWGNLVDPGCDETPAQIDVELECRSLAVGRWGDVVDAELVVAKSEAEPIRYDSFSWETIVNAELSIVGNVFSLLSWAPLCALREAHAASNQAFEMLAAQPVQGTELSWVRVLEARQSDCLRFIAQHYRNTRHLAIHETSRLGEKGLLRLVCGMRMLESLDVDASPFGGNFPDPQRLFDRLAKYCPRLQHLSLAFRHEMPFERHTLTVRTLVVLGQRLLTLDLGAVTVRVAGGSKTIATCCPQLERLSARLCQQRRPVDSLDPTDLAKGCTRLAELDLDPVDWEDSSLQSFSSTVSKLQSLALRKVMLHATVDLLAPLSAHTSLLSLHLALHARTDASRAVTWLRSVAQLQSLRSLCLDYAAPLGLQQIAHALGAEGPRHLTGLTVHGCHCVDDAALEHLVEVCPRLEQLRLFPDSWREVGDVREEGLRLLLHSLPQLRALAISSSVPLLGMPSDAPVRLRSLSLFSPVGDAACFAAGVWTGLRHLWLGPHKLMQHGVGADSSVSDEGLALVAGSCKCLVDLIVASMCITDAGVESVLRGCKELRRLRLGGRGVTDASLVLLGTLTQPRLERFALWFAGVSAEGSTRAQEEMPWTYFDIEASDPSL